MAAGSGKFSKSSRNSQLGHIVDSEISGGGSKGLHDQGYALDFIESPQGLAIKLYPAQRLIVKCVFGIPIDYKEGEIVMWDNLKQTKNPRKVKESEFLHILHDQGRCNVDDWRDIPPWGFGTNVIFAGRRGGKSQIVSAIAGSCLRNLLSIHDPQAYYNLVPGSTIDFTMIGTDEDSSTRLYDKLKADVIRSPYFAPYLVKTPNMTTMGFLSEADRARSEVNPSIHVTAFPCTTRAVRGPSSYFLALDEFQHFRSNKDANSDDLYKAATPSTSQFPNADDPERADSRILVISSPLGKIGKMFDLHKQALEGGVDTDIFTIRLSTAEMNPRLPAKKLAEDYQNNPETFPAEFGGEFLDGSGSYVPPAKFDICVIPGKQNITNFTPSAVGRKYFWGFDFGTQNDATALAVSHLELVEGRGITLNFDYIDRMMVGEEFTGPGVLDGAAVKQMKELDVFEVLRWLIHMNNVLPCYKGMMDQHHGTTLRQLLNLNSITTIELIHLTDQINSLMYFALKGYIDNGNALFPDVEKFKKEFKQLVATYKSKYVLRVQAPTEKGAHDDMADAAAESAWLAQKWLDEEGKLELDPTGSALQTITLPTSIVIDPNTVSMRDLQVMERQGRIEQLAFMPPGVPVVANPYARNSRGRR